MSHPKWEIPCPSQVPERFLDIIDLERRYIQLVKSDQLSRAEYIALSHCWGESQLKTTTKANLGDYFKAIPFCQLPATFRDTFTITFALKIRYL